MIYLPIYFDSSHFHLLLFIRIHFQFCHTGNIRQYFFLLLLDNMTELEIFANKRQYVEICEICGN